MQLPKRLLPVSARSAVGKQPPSIKLEATPEMRMVKPLERVNKNRQTLEKSCQYAGFLQHILAGPNARWLLASILFPAIRPLPQPEPVVRGSESPQLIDITAYVLYIDASVRQEIVFKLLPCTQAKLVRLHRDICLTHGEDVPSDEGDREAHSHELNETFAHVIDRAIFQSSVSELENLEDDGSGELLGHRPEIVKKAILDMLFGFLPTKYNRSVDSSTILTVYTDPAPQVSETTVDDP